MKKIFFISAILLMSLLSCSKLEDVLGINYDDGLTYTDSSMESKNFKTIVFGSSGEMSEKIINFIKLKNMTS